LDALHKPRGLSPSLFDFYFLRFCVSAFLFLVPWSCRPAVSSQWSCGLAILRSHFSFPLSAFLLFPRGPTSPPSDFCFLLSQFLLSLHFAFSIRASPPSPWPEASYPRRPQLQFQPPLALTFASNPFASLSTPIDLASSHKDGMSVHVPAETTSSRRPLGSSPAAASLSQ